MEGDIVIFTEEFYLNAKLPKAITASFITLIPKCLNPQKFADYIQICLIVCLQKVLSKHLVARLKKILYKVISCSQMAFVPGRKLLDEVFVLNKIIELEKKEKNECIILKVDFEQAYDCVC